MTPENQPKHLTRVRVRYAETDQMGVVYYANYLVWMEIGRTELFRSEVFNYKDLEESEGLFLAVIESNCRYLSPARYDQEITVETTITGTTPRIVEFAYNMFSAETGTLLAKGSTRHMWLNREWRPSRLPEKYLAVIQRLCPEVNGGS
jgi:acyl-CoA thioester hydrolase